VRKIYDLREDTPVIENIRNATLNTEDYGVASDHGLFGSEEWWAAIERGDLTVHTVEGVISDVYESGHNDFPQFEVDDGTRKTDWVREGDDSAYVIGAPVRIEYVVERHKPRWSTPRDVKLGLDKATIVLAIWVGTNPLAPTDPAPQPAPEPPAEAEPRPGPYTVWVYDNYHYMDQDDGPYRFGEFDTCRAAVAACKRMVEDFLLVNHKPGMSAEDLWGIYTAFGDDPGILSPGDNCRFSAWDFAKQRCEELCRQG
jgi:hypothetical protein